MMIFGRSLFGGAAAGQVLAVGLASALVSAVAVPEVTRLAHADGQAQASSHVEARRLLIPASSQAAAAAAVTGAARVDFTGFVLAEAQAFGLGKGTADYLLAGEGHARFIYQAIASKRTRAPRALAWGYASGEAEAQVYEYVYGMPAVARATALGTTYHVGRTDARPKATGQALPAVIAGAGTLAEATAVVTGECRRAAGSAGLGEAVAHHLVDAAVTRGNGLEYELMGAAVGSATADVSNVGVYQIQKTRAYAYAAGANPAITRGVKAAAKASATGRGIALGTATGAAALTGNSVCVAIGDAQYRAGTFGSGTVYAAGNGAAAGQYNRSGNGLATPTLAIQHLEIGVQGIAAVCASEGAAHGQRNVSAEGLGIGVCSTEAFIQINDLSKAPIERTVVLDAEGRLVSVEHEPRLILI